MNINLVGAMYCLQEAAQVMGAQKSGSIINMSSLMGIQGYPMRSAYVASKFALIGITETMARELGPLNVRVNALMPGAVSGENMDRILARRAEAEGRYADEIERENYTDVAALKRWVSPEEVGRAALYYASDLSSAITGDKMKVDCGRF
jgi:NAD(P)-dependent dehydrogenase (short-subunit alcohol dehydrogenase family)